MDTCGANKIVLENNNSKDWKTCFELQGGTFFFLFEREKFNTMSKSIGYFLNYRLNLCTSIILILYSIFAYLAAYILRKRNLKKRTLQTKFQIIPNSDHFLNRSSQMKMAYPGSPNKHITLIFWNIAFLSVISEYACINSN